MLRLENITKDFQLTKDQVTNVLKGISVQFRSCEFVSILGHSGCGKTTLLNLIGGLDKCTSGGVYLDGTNTASFSDADWNDYRNRRIGFVFQSYNLIPHQTVLRNVEMPLILAEVPEEERKRRALEALDKVGLRDQAKKRPMQMSGGQMQRVAIARAIVNDPSIILADEPTGALDSESGRQVMNILKDISKDKLVIMVTHNDSLAEEYSTRIIKMRDGVVIDDSNEYVLEDCLADEEKERLALEEESRRRLAEIEAKRPKKKQNAVGKAVKGAQKAMTKIMHSLKRKGTTYMSFGTAVRLSASNLNSKKGRSLLTSLAGSIGIIGIMLVLCLSNGARGYIDKVEENALSIYPMAVSTTNSVDLTSMVELLQKNDPNKEKYPDSEIITPKTVLGNVLNSIINSALSKPNDLAHLKQYINTNFNEDDGYVKYDYGVDFSVFCNYTRDPDNYMQVDPFLEGMTAMLEKNPTLKKILEGSGMLDYLEGDSGIASMISVWEQLPSNTKLLNSQYDLIGKNSRWPSTWNEVVLVVDSQNQVYDFSLFALGLAGEDEVAKALGGNSEFLSKKFTIDDLLSLEYKIMSNSDYFVKNEDGTFDDSAVNYANHRKKEFVEAHAETVKVVGVIRPKQGVDITCMNGLIGYNEALTQHMSERAKNSDIYKAQTENPSVAVSDYDKCLTVNKIPVEKGDELNEDMQEKISRYLGVADFDNPSKIYFYANSFTGKENIDKFIKQYNAENEANVEYTDMLGTITRYVDTLTTTITYVLIGFAAISLVVSSIMIAIIIYTSVLERRKEIGVLRSIGARKKDISTVFISESAILGVISGAIGILLAYILSLIADTILTAILGIPDLAQLAWWHPVMMMLISVALSILSGFVPARIASNKDPVECLRSE